MPEAPPRETLLGRAVAYPARYDPTLLQPIDRAVARRQMGLGKAMPFVGEDLWRIYELSWLLPGGKPCNAVATLRVECGSPATVESKSLKLYVNSLAQETFADAGAVQATMAEDLAKVTGRAVAVDIAPDAPPANGRMAGVCLDDIRLATSRYQPDADLLEPLDARGGDEVHTHLFRSLCPVTGQPDWGSIAVAWQGRRLWRPSLLAYLVSYRAAASFHEDVVERIFVDVQAATEATELTVQGCFLRRGGIDINPFRATGRPQGPSLRLPRQ